jgi:hypothetical protein
MLTRNLKQNVKEPTRITKNTSTCLDLLFTNIKYSLTETSIVELGFSDHKSVIFTTQIKQSSLNKMLIIKRIYNEKNMNRFKEQLQTIKWSEI